MNYEMFLSISTSQAGCEMTRLTEREQAVWEKRNAGLTFKQIAEELGLCVQTVSFAYRKAERKVEYEKERLKPTELEVYKRALELAVSKGVGLMGYGTIEKDNQAKVKWGEQFLNQARKEIENEH